MKTAASTHDQTDKRLVMIAVIVVHSRWSYSDGGESHGGLGVLMEVVFCGLSSSMQRGAAVIEADWLSVLVAR